MTETTSAATEGDTSEQSETTVDRQSSGVLRDILCFLKEYRMWWLSPILLILLLMIIVALLAGPAKMPFIYR